MPCSKETKDFYFGIFVQKTQIGVGNLPQLILDQTVQFAIKPSLFVKHFC